MIVYVYKSLADSHVVDKTSYLTLLATLNGTMREEQDITTPSILLEMPLASSEVVTQDSESVVDQNETPVVVDLGSIPVFNYVFIPSLRRYYFVTSIVATTSARGAYRLYRVNLNCDVLMSFKNEFISLIAMVERNEFKYDKAIKDTAHPFKDSLSREVFYLENDSFWRIDEPIAEIRNIAMTVYLDSYNKLLEVLPESDSEAFKDLLGREVDSPSGSDVMRGVFSASASPAIRTVTYIINQSEFYKFIKLIPENEKSYIKSVIAFPLNLEQVCTISQVEIFPTIANDLLTDLNTFKFSKTNEFSKYIYLGSLTFPEYDFKNDNPISMWVLYVPYLGRRELDYSLYAGKTIQIYLIFSLADNSATIYLIDDEGQRVENVDFSFGNRVGVDSSNAQEVKNNQISIALNAVISTVGNAISIGAGVATDNPFMIAKGVTGEASVIANTITNSLNNLPSAKTSQQSSSMGMTSPMTAYIEHIYKDDVLTSSLLEERYAHIYGLPLNQPYRLENLKGFTKVADIHLEGLTCTSGEKESIYNFLKAGVIL